MYELTHRFLVRSVENDVPRDPDVKQERGDDSREEQVNHVAKGPSSGGWSFRQLWRIGISKPARPGNRGMASAGASTALSAFWLGAAGALILVVSVVLTWGFALAALAIWLLPAPPAERRARGQLAGQLKFLHCLADDLRQPYHQAHARCKRGGSRR